MKLSVLFLLLACAMAAPHARAGERIDDSGSRVLDAAITRMRWDDMPGPAATVSGKTRVLVRLDVSPWQGRQGRIYMALAPQAAGRVDVAWSTRGPLMPGRMRDGERRLVYAGPITTPLIEDVQQLEIRADGTRLDRPEQLEMSFDIEMESP